MLEELKKLKNNIDFFNESFSDSPDYPEDEMMEIEAYIDSAINHVTNFDWEQHAIDVKDGAEEAHNDAKRDR